MIVIDTNVVLDLMVFRDPATPPLRDALQSGRLQWIASSAMREELLRVLAYPQIVPRLAYYQLSEAQVLAEFDRFVQLRPASPRAKVVCKDPDDQKFIDLAVAHQTLLLSKDQAVLRLKKRLEPLGVSVAPLMPAVLIPSAS